MILDEHFSFFNKTQSAGFISILCLYYTKFRLGKFGIDSKFTQYVTKFAFGYFCQTLPTSQDKVETKHQNINTYDIHDSGKSIYVHYS